MSVADWGIDIDALEAQATAALARARSKAAAHAIDGRFVKTSERLPALAPLLHAEPLARLITTYLGGPSRYDAGDNLLYYPPTFRALRRGEFPASEWHHDRCGRRLKLFVFLRDVTAGAHPMLIAAR